MSDKPDDDSKTELATEKKKTDALKKGNTPHSREIASMATLMAATCIMMFTATDATTRMVVLLKDAFIHLDEHRLLNGTDGLALMRYFGGAAMSEMAGALTFLALSGIAASLVQNPPALIWERIKPQTSRISLSAGWKRIFGKQALVELAKGLAKIGAVMVVVGLILKGDAAVIMSSMHVQLATTPVLVLTLCVKLLAGVVLCSIAIACADLLWSRHKWSFDLRMTKQEVKDEMKQAEGDPLVKARLRSLQRDRKRRRMMQAVPGATLIIANPTHFAIAISYEPGLTIAPVVVAKGKDLIALKIKEIAAEHGIPVLENKKLARALYDTVEISQMIPSEFYHAVAELLQYVYSLDQARAPVDHKT